MSALEARTLEELRRRWGVPALVAGLVPARGEPQLLAVGRRRRSRSAEPVGLEDRWHLGSCAKAMTALAVARLVERGALAWDTPVGELLADLEPAPAWSEVRVEEVLRHQGGFPANPPRAWFRAAIEDRRPPKEQRDALLAPVLAAQPQGRGRFVYSNLGTTAVGAAVERLTGLPFEVALEELVLAPLGITSAGIGAPLAGPWGHPALLAGLGKGRPWDPSGVADNPPALSPAGTFHMTVQDWARFLRLFLLGAEGPHLVSPATTELLLGPASSDPVPQGMGWGRARIPGVAWGHQGSNTAWVATALLAEDRSSAGIVVVNDGRSRLLRDTAHLAAALVRGEGVGD